MAPTVESHMLAFPFFLSILMLIGAAIFFSLLLARRPGAIGVLILIAIAFAFFGCWTVAVPRAMVMSPPVVVTPSGAPPAPIAPAAPGAAPAPHADGVEIDGAVDSHDAPFVAEKPESPADVAQQKPASTTPPDAPARSAAAASTSSKPARPAWVDRLPAMENGVYQQNV